MKIGTSGRRRKLCAGLIAAVVPTAAIALLSGPPATGAADPCAASEVAKTAGSVAKSMGPASDERSSSAGTRPVADQNCRLAVGASRLRSAQHNS